MDSCSVRAPKVSYPSLPQPVVGKVEDCSGSMLGSEYSCGNVAKSQCKPLSPKVGISTESAKGVNDSPLFESVSVKGNKDVMPKVDINGEEFEGMEDDVSGHVFPLCSGDRYWELQNGTDEEQIKDVQGRLKSCVLFWQDVLHAPPTVVDWIQNGYKLPLLHMPTPICQSNHGSALGNKEFVADALKELIGNRCVRRVSSKPYICSPLSVVSNSEGKLRLVLNLRH